MLEASHPIMHGDHKQWLNENGSWLDDVHLWQDELKTAEDKIEECIALFKKHSERLMTHAAAIRCRELKLREHEHAIVEYEQGGEGNELPELAKAHLEEATHHTQQRAAHELFKRKHHEMLAHWNALLKAMKECVK